MKKVIINGLFYTQKTTGVHRFARELLIELDKIVDSNIITIAVPKCAEDLPEFRNIKIEKVGNFKGVIWEQFVLPKYIRKNNAESISFCNTMPLLCPGIMCIHDAAYKVHPEYFTTLHGKLSCLWHRIHFRLAVMSKKNIITVSYFSKYQIIDAYKVDPKRLWVIGNAWQHMLRINEDTSIIERYKLTKGDYFFTLGNISKNKNTKWIYEVAKRNKQYKFVITGRKAEVSNEIYEKLDNVINLGYICDEEIKALYKNCKAFIFPSIHEGFGIPPMEALSQGAKIIVANTTSLPEIYKNSAYYIDPYDYDINLKNLLSKQIDDGKTVLENYTWEKSAIKLLQLIKTI